MPKGQVTEEELASGLKGLSGFGSLGGTQKVRRDSPFRDSRVEPRTIELPAPVEERTPVEIASPVVTNVSEPRSVVEPIRSMPTQREKRLRGEKAPSGESKKKGQRKSDIYTERVTLQMSPEMRDEVDSLAREIQRSKTTKKERITANSVMRVAIRLLLGRFSIGPGDTVNSEEELLALAKQKLSEG